MTAFTLSPDVVLTLVTAGVLAICVEFLRPGTVVAGVAGSVTVLLAGRSLVFGNPQGILGIHAAVAIANLVPLMCILIYLFSAAVRARRNKRVRGTIS